MNFKIGDKVFVVEDVFADEKDTGCVGMVGTVVGFNNRIEVLIEGAPCPLGFDDFELEVVK